MRSPMQCASSTSTRVRLFTRRGYDWTERYPLICEAMAAIPARSVILDGEAVYCDDSGRLQIGTVAGFVSERVAGIKLECLAGFIGIRTCADLSRKR
jgi:ATP-dependent DNA ligase